MTHDSASAIVFDDSCIMEKDFSCSLMGKIRIKEPEAWTPDLNNELDDDSSYDEESVYDEVVPINEGKRVIVEDPFEIYKLLNKKYDKEDTKGEDLTFPPGFTPNKANKNAMNNNEKSTYPPNDNLHSSNVGISSVKSGRSQVLKIKPGGSILEVMEDLIKVGQTMRCNMEGCMKNIEAIVGFQGEKHVVK
nr:hypothetical protein [Tanacetum cinerariifolium]